MLYIKNTIDKYFFSNKEVMVDIVILKLVLD